MYDGQQEESWRLPDERMGKPDGPGCLNRMESFLNLEAIRMTLERGWLLVILVENWIAIVSQTSIHFEVVCFVVDETPSN